MGRVEAQRRGSVRAIQGTLWIRAFEWTASAERSKTRKDTDGPSGYSGTTALAHAASGGSSECVRLLLAARADVRLPHPPRANALHYAAFKVSRQPSARLQPRAPYHSPMVSL